MDAATPPSAPCRMTGSWGIAKSESFHFRVTNHNGVWCFVYGSVFDALSIGFGLIHVLSIKQERIIVCSSSGHTLMNRILLLLSRHPPCHSAKRACLELQHPLFNTTLTLLSFCTKGLPGVAEFTVFISEGKPSSWGEGARQYDLAVRK